MRRRYVYMATMLIAVVISSVYPSITRSLHATSQATFDREQWLQWAHNQRKEPIDAKMDPVWKAIPELNGLEVDLEATKEKMRRTSFSNQNDIPWVYKQVEPKIKLADILPAPIYRGNPEKKQMSLMVNVAWGTEHLPSMLETFKKYHVKATFFVDGSWLSKNRDMAKRILQDGHEIGSHAYSHPDMARISREKAIQEIERTNLVIEESLQIHPTLFAPPSGSFTSQTVQLAHERGMKTIMWTLDTVDWKKPPASVIVKRIVPRGKGGSMVLMHPTGPTAEALRQMIPELQRKGLALVTVSELLSPVRQP